MKLIFLSKRGASSLTLDSQRDLDRALLVVALLLPFVIGLVGHWAVSSWRSLHNEQQMVDSWQAELDRQAALVQQTREQMGHEMAGLTVRVAELQARIMRLDALGEQVAQVAQLDSDEFDFAQRPAVGGPVTMTHAESLSVGGLTALERQLEQLAFQVGSREQQLAMLESQVTAEASRSEKFIAGRPVTKGWLSSRFGQRTDPFNGSQAWHQGVDFAGKEGAEVVAVAGGVVTRVDHQPGYGKLLEVSHGDGFMTRYAHNKSNLVEVGDVVSKGQVIALMGSTGRSTGPHVHFEVLHGGVPQDPERYIYRASR